MHDTTCTPALADIAAMLDVLFENGVDPTVLSPTLPFQTNRKDAGKFLLYSSTKAIDCARKYQRLLHRRLLCDARLYGIDIEAQEAQADRADIV